MTDMRVILLMGDLLLEYSFLEKNRYFNGQIAE